ncbi:hypothetical protein LTR10_010001 [Elasticomyces elasticus]|nr:hypothetical protein LTR10_010001 [Elasticomyces elasticus]KAK4970293.1 hypothetical protein LTR42_008460 [Elasticomyces elasticus]
MSKYTWGKSVNEQYSDNDSAESPPKWPFGGRKKSKSSVQAASRKRGRSEPDEAPKKRQRSSGTAPTDPWDAKVMRAAITELSDETVRQLLLEGTRLLPSLQEATLAEANRKKTTKKQVAKVLDFDRYLMTARNIWEKALDRNAVIDPDDIAAEFDTLVKAESSYATKRSALEALCEIDEWIVNDGESDLGRSIREEMNEYENRSLVETMCYVVEIMTDEEKARLREEKNVVGRISDLGGDGLDEALELGLDEVLELIEGQKDDQP